MKKNKIMDVLNSENVLYVKDLLPYLKGNKITYYNLDESSKEVFKRTYQECKNIQDKKIDTFYYKRIKDILNDETLILDMLYKQKIMNTLLSMTDFEKYKA